MSEGQSDLIDGVLSANRTREADSARAQVVAIASGQSGVGKTNIATNLAIALSTRGLRVCVLDADARPANIHALLGYTPKLTLEHLLASDARRVEDVLAVGPSGIKVLPNAVGIADYVSLDEAQQHRLIMALDELERRFDYILIDTAAGVRNTVLYFLQAAQHTLMVITPEPKTLSGAFAMLQALAKRGGVRPVHVLVNMARDYEESRNVFLRFASTVEKYLRIRIEYLGFIRIDETVTSSVELKRPVILLKRRAPASRCFFELAADLARHSADWKSTGSFAQFWVGLSRRRAQERVAGPSTDEFRRPPTGELQRPATGEWDRPRSAAGRPRPATGELARPPAADAQTPATGEFPRPKAALSEEPKLSRYTITRAAQGLIADEKVPPDDAETFLSGLINEFTERFGRYPFRLRDVLAHSLELEDYPRAEIRHLAMLLDDLYEKRHQRPIHGLESSVMRLFAHAADSEERIVQLAEQLRTHYQARFGKPLHDPAADLLARARTGQQTEEDLGRLVTELADIYQERFGRPALPRPAGPHMEELRELVATAITGQRRVLTELEGVLARLDQIRPDAAVPG